MCLLQGQEGKCVEPGRRGDFLSVQGCGPHGERVRANNFSASIGLSWPILGRVTPSVVLLGYMLITLCCSAGSSTRVREYL